MKKHFKKMIAPIIITVLIALYLFGIALSIFFVKLPTAVYIPAIIIPAVLGGVMVGVCIQRLKEIRSGEEDDLSKY